jgi:thiamine-monophosphate kinase
MGSGNEAISEAQIIELLAKIFQSTDPRIEVGIGDDAAVVKSSGDQTSRQVITTDMAVEGVHFIKQWSSAFDIGRKATAANLADLLAMGAIPDYLVVAISLTGSEEISWINELADGIAYEAKLGGASVIGGDLARGQSVTISMTAIGTTAHPILRKGAKVGDSIYLSSLSGWSAAGLRLLENGVDPKSVPEVKAVSEFCAPSIDYGLDFSKATSMCDISDAILIQAEQMALESGVAFSFDMKEIAGASEFEELSTVAKSLDVDVFEFIFGGGEDHVLLATGKSLPGIHIGEVVAGSGLKGLEMKKAPVTWRHFN